MPTPRRILGDITNIASARHDQPDIEILKAINVPVETSEAKFFKADEESDDIEYPPIEYIHPDPIPSPQNLFDIRVDPNISNVNRSERQVPIRL
mmetsp:Transcript_19652/g.30788  ORF Transcript_19652/g.30788 Transcript_19652/m.30788 type:complete len:94 (-) Transcript_19652:10-291(-)